MVLTLACVTLSGCGVEFGTPPAADGFFTSLDVSGNMRAGEPLTAAVAYQQNYARVVEITCELRQGKELVKEIGRGKALEYPNGNPDTTPFPGNFSLDFSIDEPGKYKVECFTPADEDNFIIDEFTVKEPPVASPTAGVLELG